MSRRSPLALAILSLLGEEPMHPYRMQQLIKERDKDDVINVRMRASLYQVIDRLVRDGLIAVQETIKDEKRPERTVYRLTERGQETARAWLHEMLARPAREFPEFPAALAHLPLLSPHEVLVLLEQRASALADEIAAIEERLADGRVFLPRLFLVDVEYARATRAAEAVWLRETIEALRRGEITWSEEWPRAFAKQMAGAPTMNERRCP